VDTSEWVGPAVLLLLGSTFGAGGTLFVQAWGRRSERRTAVKRAARLVDVDLRWAEVAASGSIARKEWWYLGRPLTSDGWDRHRDVLTTALSYHDWHVVVRAVEAVAHLEIARAGHIKIARARFLKDPAHASVVASADHMDLDDLSGAETASIDDDTITRIEPMLRHVEEGRTALKPLVRDGFWAKG
jgi:hypothetical protein